MTGCLRSLTAILALRILLLPTGLLATASGDEPSCNAVYVAMSVPEQVAADEVFPVTVTVRNTGTATWQGRPICLRHVALAVWRELAKEGHEISKQDLGALARFLPEQC